MDAMPKDIKDHAVYSFILSFGLHLLLLIIFTYLGVSLEKDFKKIEAQKLKELQPEHVYIELESEADPEEEKDTLRSSLKNILETGRLSKKKGVHIVGNEDAYLTLSTLTLSASEETAKPLKKQPEANSEEAPPTEVPELIESIVQKARSGGYITENSLEEKFNVDKGDSSKLKLGSKHIDAYPFTYNIIRKFKKNLTLYLKYHDGFLNPETVVADLEVDRQGQVSFNGFISASQKQPKMNYLIRSSVEGISKLSAEEMHDYPTNYEVVSIPMYLSFSGPPLNVFYFGVGNW